MALTTAYQNAELTAPTAELRSAFAELRREIDILRRREEIREAELAELLAEAEQARQIQQQVGCGSLPSIRGAVLSAHTNPAGLISGDVCRARRIGDSAVALFVADSTGHGLAASLLSATVIGAMELSCNAAARQRGKEDRTGGITSPYHHITPSPHQDSNDPAEFLSRLNRQLLSYSLVDCEFVTAVCAEYDETTRVFRWSRAGSPPPVLLRNGDDARRLDSPGLALGIDAGADFCCREIQLQTGDTILLHTDGLEALHARCTSMRDERAFLCWIESLSKTNLSEQLRELVQRHWNTSRSSGECDDITLLTLQITE